MADNINDPAYIRQQVDAYGKKPGVNPSVINDPNYWVNTVQQHGGWTPENAGYFGSRMMTPEGPPEQAKQSAMTTGMPTASPVLDQFKVDPTLGGQISLPGTSPGSGASQLANQLAAQAPVAPTTTSPASGIAALLAKLKGTA